MNAAETFFDTNVLLYLLSADHVKADAAEELVARGGVISVQVLNELAAVASRKLAMTWPEIREVLDTVRAVCRVEPVSVETHELGLELAARNGIPVYDAMIAAAAILAGCRVLYSEDFQAGQVLGGKLRARNPFR